MSTRPVPTSLASWPGVTDLLVSYKFFLFSLWSAPSQLVSVVGVGGPGTIERLVSDSRHDESVVLEALRELDRRRLVALDETTREVGIRKWCRFHKFTGHWASAAAGAYQKIESPRIKSIWAKEEGVKLLFPTKSTAQPPNATATTTTTNSFACTARERAPACEKNHSDSGDLGKPKTPASRGRPDGPPPPVGADGKFKYPYSKEGITCWTKADLQAADQLLAAHGVDAVRETAKKIAGAGGNPLPSLISKQLKGDNHVRIEQGQPYSISTPDPDPFYAAAARSAARRAAG